MENKILLWLDDVRNPHEDDWLVFAAFPDYTKVIWVKSHKEFVEYINENGLPFGINFDHDLADEHYTPKKYWDIEDKHLAYDRSVEWAKSQNWKEETGFSSAKWLVEYCIDNNKDLPRWYTHSANPVGKANIDNYLVNYLKHVGKENITVKDSTEFCGVEKTLCCNNPSWCTVLETENNLGDKLT